MSDNGTKMLKCIKSAVDYSSKAINALLIISLTAAVILSGVIYVAWIVNHVLANTPSAWLVELISKIKNKNDILLFIILGFCVVMVIWGVMQIFVSRTLGNRLFGGVVTVVSLVVCFFGKGLFARLSVGQVQLFFACLPPITAAATLYLGCKYYSHPWSNGMLSRFTYWMIEALLRLLRSFVYILCMVLLTLSNNEQFRENKLCTLNALITMAPLYVSILQSLYRLTYRRWPNYCVATACLILYLALLTIPYSPQNLWGFSIGLSEYDILDAIHELPETLKGSVIVAAILSVCGEALINLVASFTSSKPASLAQNRRRNRRRLLTHWYYTKDGVVSSREDTISWLIMILCVIFLITATMALYDDPVKSQNAAVDQTAQTQSDQTDSDPNNGEGLPLSMYLVLLAVLLCVPGLVSMWNISDDRLLQSEYFYLTYRGSQLKHREIISSGTHWQDYCQVLVNMYSNVSGLASEDGGYHALCGMLNRIYRYLSRKKDCAGIKFFGDILSAKGDVNSVLLREQEFSRASEDSDNESNQAVKNEQLAQDALFANDFMKLLESCYDDIVQKALKENNKLDYLDGDPIAMIHRMNQCMFHESEGSGNLNPSWRNRLAVHNVSAQEGIRLIKMDALIHILQREDSAHCGLCWLGCPDCENHEQCKSYKEHHVVNRLELILTYPFIVINCFLKRWPGSFAEDEVLYREDIINYYKGIFLSEIYVTSVPKSKNAEMKEKIAEDWSFAEEKSYEQIDNAAKRAIHFLRVNKYPMNNMTHVAQEICPEDEMNSVEVAGADLDLRKIRLLSANGPYQKTRKKNRLKTQRLDKFNIVDEKTVDEINRIAFSLFVVPKGVSGHES